MNNIETIQWGKWRITWVSPFNAEIVEKALESNTIDGIGLSPHYGFKGDVALLKRFPQFKGIVVTNVACLDVDYLSAFPNIRFLSLGGERKSEVDFRVFHQLVDLRINWHRDDILPNESSLLESLYIKGFNPKNKNLTSLPSFTNLHGLELVQSNIVTLDGIHRISKLTDVDISFCKNLESVAALGSTGVMRLHLESCNKISDLTELVRCRKLRSIKMSGCGNLASLHFLNKFPALEEFRFVKMDVLDGDMTPLLRLKSIGFIDKRKYSHTNKEIATIISKRNSGDTIPNSGDQN